MWAQRSPSVSATQPPEVKLARPAPELDARSAPDRGWHYYESYDVKAPRLLKQRDGKVFRDGDHWVMFYFGVGQGGAHIMAAFSWDLQHWTSHPEPLYKAGGHPGGLDAHYAHKISLVHNPANDTFYLFYCAVGKEGTAGNKGRCIGLLASRKLTMNRE